MANETTLEEPRLPTLDLTEAVSGADSGNGLEVALPGSAGERYADWIGVFEGDPMLDAMMENIRQRRREMNTDDSIE